MSLVSCPACGNEVSDRAVSCPKCGNPIAGASKVAATVTNVVTTQATAKRYKGQMVLSILAIMVGMMMIAGDHGADGIGNVGMMVAVGGLLWFVLSLALSWWHHS